MGENKGPMGAVEIRKLLPHRYPFLLIDRVEKIFKSKTSPVGNRIEAYKAVTQNEPFFQGHFPNYPVMPGVLMIEAMCQAFGVLLFSTVDYFRHEKYKIFLTGVDRAKFRAQVEPGQVLRLEAEITKVRKDQFWVAEAKAVIVHGSGAKEIFAAQATVSGVMIKKGNE